MKYVNREMKIDQIISYFNQRKINLIPPFQRGTVWKLADRQKLLINMIMARPIPAIFLYKQAEGAQFAYNILDGKQRLESLILFVGDRRDDLKIERVEDYFFGKPAKKESNFTIQLDGNEVGFAAVEDELVRAFREYAIPTIEIDLDDESASIDEVVNLFIDINQQGVKVSRFDVVKALGKDPLFRQVFDLLAIKQTRRGKSVYYKAKSGSPFVFVMKRLNIVNRLPDKNAQVDRMWERLTEIALFSRSQKHRPPAVILKAFIRAGDELNPRLTVQEVRKLRSAFDFIAKAYRSHPGLMTSRLATDQPQFYTLVTTLLSSDVMQRFEYDGLVNRIALVSQMLDGSKPAARGVGKALEEFRELAAKQTTHPARRERRQQLLIQAINAIGTDNGR